jgi:hypothetical protein
MSASKATIPLVATMMVLLMGVILYPQGSANADTYRAKPVGANAAPDCSLSRELKGKGWRALLQAIVVT